eukprot:TRINITY_DN8059_c0_g1_i2.p3 TRINITY_DN8059_c0_g1~~TRINITY_DN8059_c0_g1_i2.p3  ORF type:complete len:119 (+),score=13.40 TRINITY_DN8059_c0_g1_i2:25-357(+)
MIRRPPRSTPLYSSAASDVYKRQTSFDNPEQPPSSSPSHWRDLSTSPANPWTIYWNALLTMVTVIQFLAPPRKQHNRPCTDSEASSFQNMALEEMEDTGSPAPNVRLRSL